MNENIYGTPGILIVISAPSGAGKTSICRRLFDLCPNLRYSVSFTTRTPRPSEENGKDYYFVSVPLFKEMIDRGEFVEWVENYGQFYGTPKKIIEDCLKKGRDLIVDVEPRGARKLKERYSDGIFVFILPPSMAELRGRLVKRGSGEIEKRLITARKEIEEVLWYDYTIFNERLDEAVDLLRSIYVAEKSKKDRMMGRINDFIYNA